MPYDEGLAHRIREVIKYLPGSTERKMFGRIGFLINGNMACGVINTDLIIRVGPDNYEDALTEDHTREFDMTGRPMTGWMVVSAKGYAEDEDLRKWLSKGVEYAQSLPGK